MFKILSIIGIIFIFTGSSYAQEKTTAAESRKSQLTKLLDYRFKGGTYTFEKIFNTTVKYPAAATSNCIQGIIIASFDVTCNGDLGFITIKNPLRYGIDDEVKKFFVATNGQWNKCHDKKYEHFEIPIQLKLKGTPSITNEGLFTFEGKNPGYICNGEPYFLEKANKYLDKKNTRKASYYIDLLIHLDPYNAEYYEMKKKAVTMGGKKKRKKK